MTNLQQFINIARERGYFKSTPDSVHGIWSEDFQRWAEHVGFEHAETTVERDEHSSRHINRYTHSEIDADLIVRHVAHNEGSKSSWRFA